MPLAHRPVAVAAGAILLSVVLAACTGSPEGGANDDPNANTTITFWHSWSAPGEVAAVLATIDAFEKKFPHIRVKVVGNMSDDAINAALAAAGSAGPDVVSSFTTDSVGEFCSSGMFVDLGPFLAQSNIHPEETFPTPLLDYTQYQGERCALPLLSDSYGLYYNKDAFKAAGISSPPKTMSEFEADAIRLTKSDGNSYSQLGFMPVHHDYEADFVSMMAMWAPTYFDAAGKSTVATDPAVQESFRWQKGMVDALGGYSKLERYRSTFGDEFSDQNPFMTGQVAMAIDGEWRAGMIDDTGVDLNYGVAPFPVPDDRAGTYGMGYLSGTIIGIAGTSEKQNAAWEFVRFITTDTRAVVDFSNAIHNIPSTFAALTSAGITNDPHFKVFIGIAQNPNSNTTPSSINGGSYQVTLQDVGYAYHSGQSTSLSALLDRAAEQIDTNVAHAQ